LGVFILPDYAKSLIQDDKKHGLGVNFHQKLKEGNPLQVA